MGESLFIPNGHILITGLPAKSWATALSAAVIIMSFMLLVREPLSLLPLLAVVKNNNNNNEGKIGVRLAS